MLFLGGRNGFALVLAATAWHFACGDTREKHLFAEITVMASLQPVALRVGADVVQVREKKSVTRAVVSHSHNYIKYVYAALHESPARWHRVSRNVLSILHYKCCWPSSWHSVPSENRLLFFIVVYSLYKLDFCARHSRIHHITDWRISTAAAAHILHFDVCSFAEFAEEKYH